MDSIKLIEALTNANGISGFEKEVIQVAKSYIDLEKLTFEKGGLGNFRSGSWRTRGSGCDLRETDAGQIDGKGV